ncbi:MAG: tetratricopeptide 4, partial [Thermomicrobiales bacterium]|nr:tetratricopeptide 4 [Thermomicrobiales bacterium]
LFPMFPDQGWGLARTLALVVTAYPVWLGSSLELVRFRAVWVILAIAAVGLIGWRLSPRTGAQVGESGSRAAGWNDPAHRLTDLPTYRLPTLHAEAAFWLVFIIFLSFRLINPDSWHPFWGGEKPMEFAQINAIARSAYFPPYDPWYSDGYINYYYYGFYLVAFLFKATGIPAEIGFNLALPTFIAMLASGGFTVAAALARGLTGSARLALLGGWTGVLALCLLGNLSALYRLLEGIPARVDPFIFWTWGGSRAIDDVITEFPYFTGLYADLHAHVVALPLTVATIGVCLAIATTRLPEKPLVPAIARLIALALLLGTLSATNAWDVPVYAALGTVSIFMATSSVKPISRRLLALTAGSLLTLGGAWLLFLPFHLHFVALFSQIALVRDPTDLTQFLSHLGGLTLIAALGLSILFLTGFGQGVAVPGPQGDTKNNSSSPITYDPPSPWGTRLVPLIIPVAALVAAAGALTGHAVFGLLFALGSAAAAGWLRLDRPTHRVICLLLAAAMFTAAGTEIVVVADDLIGTAAYRMNTVFKFYNQVWVLLGLTGAALFALMIQVARNEGGRVARWQGSGQNVLPVTPRPRDPAIIVARLGAPLTVLVLLAALTYPVLATGPRLEQRFTPGTPLGTLDAFRWMESGAVPVLGSPAYDEISYAGDRDAIAWFFTNVSGSPVVAEASIGPYRCNGSRISAATGLPTIIGWERHQQQQRYPDTLPARVADVETLYTSADSDEKASILRRYNVEYVVVGDLERIYPIPNNECTPVGEPAGIAAFDAMVGTTLEIAHASRGTTIYRVLPVRPA